MKFLQVWLINHLVFNMDVVQHGHISLNCGWKQVVKHWYRQQFSWKQIASVVCTCFVVLNQLCKDEHERFLIKILWFCYMKNDYFIQLQCRYKIHHSCSSAIELTLLLAKSKKPHTIAKKNYYWTSYTSTQYAITLNKLSLFFSSKLYVILFDLYCLFSFKCFKSVIVADSLSDLCNNYTTILHKTHNKIQKIIFNGFLVVAYCY